MKSALSASLLSGLLLLALASNLMAQAQTNLVANGQFEVDANQDGIPDDWQAAGDRDTRQELRLVAAPDGGRCAQLVCTFMGRDTPSSHAMICQVGRISVRRGQWYRLTFRAKAEGIAKGISVGLTHTKLWRTAGLDHGFYATPQWQPFEFIFEAGSDLPAEYSRLQFWFKSTGRLWLDDVELVPIAGGRQWLPQWSGEGVPNLVPNGAFECGAANWGSYNNEPGGWGNQLYQLVGQWLPDGGLGGGGCLKIELTPQTAPYFSFDYFQAVRRQVRRIQAAHLGWLRVTPGQTLQFSAYLRSQPPGVPVSLTVVQAEGAVRQRTVKAAADWERHVLEFQPDRPFIFVAVGPDLLSTQGPGGAVWVDNVMVESASPSNVFRPRQPVESFLEIPVTGNVFTNPAAGITITIRAAAYSGTVAHVEGRLIGLDFFDQEVLAMPVKVPLVESVAGGIRRGALTLTHLLPHRTGFYRMIWIASGGTNSLRCAVISPVQERDTPVGMNHAYPWDFLVELAHVAGVRWWRDWSAKWHEVERAKGEWNFQTPDEQLGRVLRLGGQPLVLLPFPSSWWSSRLAAEASELLAGTGKSAPGYEAQRRIVAQAPQRWEDFGAYAEAVAKHYRGRVRAYHLLNEPIYTSYALPRGDGHSMADYLAAVQTGYQRIKSADPSALVVGGIGTGPDAGLTLEFVEKEGLRWVDILDLHQYDPPVPAENMETSYANLKALMHRYGGPKPLWITEYGCYADDDPACHPPRTGDAAMSRSRWPSERPASEHLVKFAAVTFAHGTRKIFLHAGSAGQINGPDEGGVFFEYGGQPRKMYAAVAALHRVLGTPDEFLGKAGQAPLHAFLFRRGDQSVGVVWSSSSIRFPLKNGVRAVDVMGNVLPGESVVVEGCPIYLLDPAPNARNVLFLATQAVPVP